MTTCVQRLLLSEDGQDLIEYALLSTFIALVCVIAVNALGTAVSNVFTIIANQLSNS